MSHQWVRHGPPFFFPYPGSLKGGSSWWSWTRPLLLPFLLPVEIEGEREDGYVCVWDHKVVYLAIILLALSSMSWPVAPTHHPWMGGKGKERVSEDCNIIPFNIPSHLIPSIPVLPSVSRHLFTGLVGAPVSPWLSHIPSNPLQVNAKWRGGKL